MTLTTPNHRLTPYYDEEEGLWGVCSCGREFHDEDDLADAFKKHRAGEETESLDNFVEGSVTS